MGSNLYMKSLPVYRMNLSKIADLL
jgi:hypothetical protein